MRTDFRAGTDSRTTNDRTDAECDDAEPDPVSRAARLLRLLKLAATTLAALVGVAKALGWL